MDQDNRAHDNEGNQEVIKAAFFEGGVAIKIKTGTARQLNANTSPTIVWRQIDEGVNDIGEVPPFETLPVHELHVQRTA